MSIEPNDPTQSGTALSDVARGALRLSRNEVETLCGKAARGAGMTWGHAEEAGRAAGWLVSRGLDGAAALLRQLREAEGKPASAICPAVAVGRWTATGDDPLCPIAVGAALSDFAGLAAGLTGQGPLRIGPVSHPILLLPFLCDVAGALSAPVALDWDGGRVVVDGSGYAGARIDKLFGLGRATLDLCLSPAAEAPGAAYEPCLIGRDTLLALNALAMKTTVPPSEQSRDDAGSAGNDND